MPDPVKPTDPIDPNALPIDPNNPTDPDPDPFDPKKAFEDLKNMYKESTVKMEGQYKTIVEDVIKLRNKIKDPGVKPVKPGDPVKPADINGEFSELQKKYETLEQSIGDMALQRAKDNINTEITGKIETLKIDPEFLKIVLQLSDIELTKKGIDHFSPDEFLRDLLEKHPGLKKRVVTPPAVNAPGKTPLVDYGKMSPEERKAELSKGLMGQ